jgi:kynureninase
MSALRAKSLLLTGYLEVLLQRHLSENVNSSIYVQIITPSDPEQRGCQLSLMFSVPVGQVYEELGKRGVVVSYRLKNTTVLSSSIRGNIRNEAIAT